MRTTVDIPDDLLQKAKIRAVERGITLKEIVTAGLEKELAFDSPKEKGRHRPIPVVIEERGWTFPFQTNAELFEAIEREEES